MRLNSRIIAVLILVICTWSPQCLKAFPGPPGPGDKVPVLHALLVIDTDSNLSAFLKADQKAMTNLLTQGFATRPNRLNLAVLEGKNCTPAQVRAYYGKLKVKPDDTLLFYYTGHGATVGEEPTLTMTYGFLKRKDLKAAMKSLTPRLAVILTDCCSKVIPPRNFGSAIPPTPKATWPVMDCLFFQHSGIADVNGCQADAFSWCYDDNRGNKGGTFTLALVPLLCKKIEDLDTDKMFVTWEVFNKRLKEDTDKLFQQTRKEILAVDATHDIKNQPGGHQVPQVFEAGVKDPRPIIDPRWLLGVEVGERPGVAAGVRGVEVAKVAPGTPASDGIKTGDVILTINGRPTPSSFDFVRAIDYSEDGNILITVVRDQKQRTVEVRLKPVKQ